MLKYEKLFILQSVKHGLSLLMYIEDLYDLFLSFFFFLHFWEHVLQWLLFFF